MSIQWLFFNGVVNLGWKRIMNQVRSFSSAHIRKLCVKICYWLIQDYIFPLGLLGVPRPPWNSIDVPCRRMDFSSPRDKKLACY